MAATYERITGTTLTTNTASVTFNSITGIYTDLVLVCYMRDTRTQLYAYPTIRFNSDTNTTYSLTRIFGDGTTAYSNRATNANQLNIGETAGASSPAGDYAPIVVNIMNYANSTTFKSILVRSGNVAGNGGINTGAQVGLWRITSAITRIDILPDGGGGTNIASGSIFTLYGIKAGS